MEYKCFTREGTKGSWHIFPGMCKGCGLCMERCPVDVLQWSDELGVYATPIVENKDPEKCTMCGMCMNVCPDVAILVERKAKAAK